jgi:hypothetical protein
MQRQTGSQYIFRKGLDSQITGTFSSLWGHLGVDLEAALLYLKGFDFVETPKLVNDTFCPLISLSLSLLAYAYLE